MAFDVKIADEYDWNALDYTIDEDITPIDPSDSNGGSGQITVKLPSRAGTKGIKGQVLTVEDKLLGSTQGRVSSVSTDGDVATITADERLILLAVTKSATPYTGTLEGAFRYYLGLCGVTTGIVVTTQYAARLVSFKGFNGIVLDELKKMCSAQGVEISEVSNNIVLRDVRTVTAYNYRNASVDWAEDDTNITQLVSVAQYDYTSASNVIAYPQNLFSGSVDIQQVDARETVTVQIDLKASDEQPFGASLTGVIQPFPSDYTNVSDVSLSQYAVVDKDDMPVSAAEWRGSGGSVTAKIEDDYETLTITITGMDNYTRAPYRLAMRDANYELINSLRILGSGVFYTRKVLDFNTGADPAQYPDDNGVLIDNPYISGFDGAVRAYLNAGRHAGGRNSLRVSTYGINNITSSQSLQYQLAGDFNTEYAGMTAAQFNALWTGKTIAEYNEFEIAKVRDTFEFQIMGNIGGARVIDDYSYYRITSATIDPSGITYDAIQDTTVADFNTAYAGMTAAQFNTAWADMTAYDFDLQPLLHGAPLPDYDMVPTNLPFEGTQAGTYGYGGYGEGGYGGS